MPDELQIDVGQQQIITRDAVREPSLFKLASGDLLLSFHVQSDVHFAHRKSLRLRKGQTTWQPEPQRSHREQAIGQAQSKSNDGLVIAPDIYTFERQPGQYVGSFFRSEDGGETFTGPHETVLHMDRVKASPYPTEAHFPTEDHPLRHFYQTLPAYYEPTVKNASSMQGPSFWRYLIEKDGRWLATMQGHWHADRNYRTTLVESLDAGKTWRFVSTIAFHYDGLGDGFCEPVLARLNDDSLLCVLRRGGNLPMGQSRSTDDGKTWSPIELLHGHGVDPDLCLMSNGILACTYGRPGRFIMFSTDGTGNQWTNHTPIGDWQGSTYMGIAQIAPDKLLVVHDYSKGSRDPEPCYIGSTILTIQRKA